MFDDGQYFVSNSNEMIMGQQDSQQAQNQQQVHQQQGGQKIRLFCSSCCTEFSSTLELNKHMDRHLVCVFYI
jgi:hypothetical protein